MNAIKTILAAALCLSGAVFLTRGSVPQPQVPSDFVVVEYWEKWVGTEAAQMNVIVDDFNRTVGRQKKIYVHYISMSNIDQKTLVAIAGGVPPDIAGLWDLQVAQLASLGAVCPLDDLAASHGIGPDTYVPVCWNGCRYDGHLYALVSTTGCLALYYNKQIFQSCASGLRAAGLDPDRPPRTLDELDQYAAVLDSRDAQGNLDRAGYVPLQNIYIPVMPFWFGDNIFDPQTRKFTLTSPQTLGMFQWIAGYSRRVGARTLNDFQSGLGAYDSPQNPFLAGKLAMQQHGPWLANFINHLKPSLSQVLVPTNEEWKLAHRTDNYAWGVAPFPSAVPELTDVTYCGFDVFMIPVGARHKNEAFEFMAYVNRQDVSEKLNKMHCKNSPLRAVSKDFLENHPNPYIEIFQKLASSPNAHGIPPVPIWPEVSKELVDVAQAVGIEGVNPSQALQAAQARLQGEYDRFQAREQARINLGIQ